MAHPIGRPTIYNEEIAEEICQAIMSYPMGLRMLCEKFDHFPGRATIQVWLGKHPEFRGRYLEAKRIQSHLLLDESIDISNEHANEDDDNLIKINRAKLRIDTYKFSAVRLNPIDYGDKKEIKGDFNLNDTTQTLMEKKKLYEREY